MEIEAEEGEIIEVAANNDYEDISSEEEFTLRQRIEELEARNLELEQIANISMRPFEQFEKENYIQSAVCSPIHLHHKQIYDPIKKTGRRTPSNSIGHRKSKGKSTKIARRKHDKSRKTKVRKKRRPRSVIDLSSDDEFNEINKTELQVALSRDITRMPSQVSLKSKLNAMNFRVTDRLPSKSRKRSRDQMPTTEITEFIETLSNEKLIMKPFDAIIDSGEGSDNSISLEEQELRLIALKSAIIKKHETRKAERLRRKQKIDDNPYSPTDFLPESVSFDCPSVDTINDQDNMDISPVSSPELHEEAKNLPIDMDLVSSDSSSPLVFYNNTCTLNTIPSDSNKNSPLVIRDLRVDMSVVKEPIVSVISPDIQDEEESALRALLLAKLNQRKANKNPLSTQLSSDVANKSHIKMEKSDESNDKSETAIDKFNLPQLALNLKDAVRRIKSKQIRQDSPIAVKMEDVESITIREENIVNDSQISVQSVPNKKSPPVDENILRSPPEKQIKIDSKSIFSEQNSFITTATERLSPKPKLEPLKNSNFQLNTQPIDGSIFKPIQKSPLTIQRIDDVDSEQSETSIGTKKSTPIAQLSSLKPIEKIVVNLQNSDSDASDDELYKRIQADKKLFAEMSRESEDGNEATKFITNCMDAMNQETDAFEQKLDAFLRSARKKVETTDKSDKGKTKLQQKPETPIAVRHLPVSAQIEYRRLIDRMSQLEKQKTAKVKLASKDQSSAMENPVQLSITIKNKLSINPNTTNESIDNKKHSNDSPKRIVKKVEPKRIDNNIKMPVIETVEQIVSLSDEDRKKMLTRSEEEYLKHSNQLCSELERMHSLVCEAQVEKRIQYELEGEQDRLRLKLQQIEQQLNKQKHQLIKLYPNISATHKKVLENRRKNVNLYNSCQKIGKSVNGNDYKVPNDAKRRITDKLLAVSCETKKLRAMKKCEQMNVTEDSSNMSIDQSTCVPASQISVPLINKNEPKSDGETEKSEDYQNNGQNGEDGSNILKYKSPLDYLQSNRLNPDAVICPFELMGKCEDVECKYQHFT